MASVDESETTEKPLAVFPLKAYGYEIPGREPNIRFDIRSETLQRRAGVEMEDGKVFEIHGRIGGVCEFSKTHLEKEGNHVIIMVPREHRDELRAGQHYDITISSIEERRTFRAEASNDGRVTLNIQPSALESLGFRLKDIKSESRAILGFQLSNLSRPSDHTFTAFTQIEPHDGSARLSITKLGARGGDEFKVLGIKEPTLPSFVREFNASPKLEDLQNVRLAFEKDKLKLEVDGHRFPFIDYNLSTRASELVLRTHLKLSSREVRFWYDGQTYKPKLEDCRIMRFKTSDFGLKIVYEASQHRISTIASHLYVDQVLRNPTENLTVKEISSKFKMLGKPEGALGDYEFEADFPLHEYVHSKLVGLKGSAYYKARGDLGEDIVPAILLLSGWIEIKRHPFDTSENRVGCSKHGPDSLQYFHIDNRQYLFETKWRKDVQQATLEALAEIRDKKVVRRAPKEVSGALIGILDWELGRKRGVLHVQEAWRRN